MVKSTPTNCRRPLNRNGRATGAARTSSSGPTRRPTSGSSCSRRWKKRSRRAGSRKTSTSSCELGGRIGPRSARLSIAYGMYLRWARRTASFSASLAMTKIAPRATNRMYAKIATRTIVAIAPIARRTVVDSFGTVGPLGAGAGGCSMGSALDDRLAALRAELHVCWDVVAVRALQRLRRAALWTELLSRPDHLAALDARLAARGDRRVGSAVPAELRRHGVHRAAFRARPLLSLLLGLLGDHPGHLRGHPVSEADPGAEANPRAGAAGRIRRGGLQRVRERELLVRGRVRAAEHLGRRHLLERVLDRIRERDAQSANLENLDSECRKVRLRIGQHTLFDVIEARREVDDLQPVRLHLAQGHVELLDDLVLDAVLDLRRGGGAERPDELVDERLRVLHAIPEVPERPQLDHVEVGVLEQERVLRAELPVEDPLLEVVHLRLLDDAEQGLDEFAQDGDVPRREGVPVRTVQVGEDLAVAVEDRDLVLPDDDVVVHPDVAGDLPHDVLSLELVVPGHRHRADEAFLPARCLVRPPRAAEEE